MKQDWVDTFESKFLDADGEWETVDPVAVVNFIRGVLKEQKEVFEEELKKSGHVPTWVLENALKEQKEAILEMIQGRKTKPLFRERNGLSAPVKISEIINTILTDLEHAIKEI